jgi:hypothetical protein
MTIKLRTGREWEPGGAGNDIVGISADLKVTVGYDHPNEEWDDSWDYWEDPDPHIAPPLTAAERMEVCDVMIARWLALKQKLSGGDH